MEKARGLKINILFLFGLIILLSGCATILEVTLFTQPYPAKNTDESIDIFLTKLPERKYKEIALIKCGYTVDKWNMKLILLKAREIGADGIILVGRTGSHSFTPMSGVISGTSFFAFGVGVSREYGLSAIAIKYIEE